MPKNSKKLNLFFWGAVLFITAAALFLTLFQSPSKIFSPPTQPITKDNWLDMIARSRNEAAGQLYAIPFKKVLIEEDWIFEALPSHFSEKDLERYLKDYGSSFSQLKSRLGSKIKIKGDVVQIDIGKTIHRYPHEYDIDIPLIFYSPEYIIRGKFEKFVTQQHIAPTLAVAIAGPIPKAARGEPLREIFTEAIRKHQPKVVVVVVIDMGGDQYFYAHPDSTPNIDFIRNNGADFSNAQISHLDTETGPGHAAIGTGSYPANSAINGNYIWNFIKHKSHALYATEDDEFDPSDLKVPTFADEFDKAMKNKPIIISYCFVPRAAIGMAGHGTQSKGGDKDLVFWISNKTLKPETNTKYYAEIPKEISSLDALENFNKAYPSGQWFGHPAIGKNGKPEKYNILASPAQVKMDGDIVLSLLNSQGVGKDDVTDLVFVTFKSTDYAGHDFAWESLEAKETFKETDTQVGRIKKWLDENVPDNYILVITADHGAAPLSEFTDGLRVSAVTLTNDINSKFDPIEKRILLFPFGNSYLFDDERMKTLNVTYEQIKDFFLNYTKDGRRVFEAVYLLPEIEARQRELLRR